MSEQQKTFDLGGEEAYLLVRAALDVVGSVSPGVHARIRRARETGGGSSRPSDERNHELVDRLAGEVVRVTIEIIGGAPPRP